MKYLPEQTAGYSVGMTETAKIAANNSLARQLADADAAHTEATSELNRYVAEQENAAFDQYYQRGQEEKQWNLQQEQWNLQQEQWQYQKDQDAAAKQEAIYNEMMTMMRNGEYGTTAELEKYLFGAAGNTSFDEDDIGYTLTPEQQRNLLLEYNTIKNDPASAERDEALRPKTDKDKLYVSALKVYDDDVDGIGESGDWISIKTDGDDIDVDTVGKAPSATRDRILNVMSDKDKKDGTVLYFDGSYYVYVDGELYGIKNEDDLGKILDNERRGLSLRDGVE